MKCVRRELVSLLNCTCVTDAVVVQKWEMTERACTIPPRHKKREVRPNCQKDGGAIDVCFSVTKVSHNDDAVQIVDARRHPLTCRADLGLEAAARSNDLTSFDWMTHELFSDPTSDSSKCSNDDDRTKRVVVLTKDRMKIWLINWSSVTCRTKWTKVRYVCSRGRLKNLRESCAPD